MTQLLTKIKHSAARGHVMTGPCYDVPCYDGAMLRQGHVTTREQTKLRLPPMTQVRVPESSSLRPIDGRPASTARVAAAQVATSSDHKIIKDRQCILLQFYAQIRSEEFDVEARGQRNDQLADIVSTVAGSERSILQQNNNRDGKGWEERWIQ